MIDKLLSLASSRSSSPLWTFRKLAEVFLISWAFIIALDIGTTIYGVRVLGYTELNPLGFPLGFAVPVLLWLFEYATLELGSYLRRKPDGKGAWILEPFVIISVIWLCMVQANAVASNLALIWSA